MSYQFCYQERDPAQRVWFYDDHLASMEEMQKCIRLCVDERDGELLPFSFAKTPSLYTGYLPKCLRPTLSAIKKLLSWHELQNLAGNLDFFHRGELQAFNPSFHWQAMNEEEVLKILSPATHELVLHQNTFIALQDHSFQSELNQYLSQTEIELLRQHYQQKPMHLLDLETILQTWSEHCSHKVFRGTVSFNHLQFSLFHDCIKRPSLRLQRPDVLLAFSGNAGIVQITPQVAIALKMETHNTPSSLEPVHGAATGVTGVVRDVMCLPTAPATPIALWNALFLQGENGPSMRVIDGVALGGNQLGIPMVGGNFFFHPAFEKRPLVFCGAISEVGLPLPPMPSKDSLQEASIVLVGGLTGRDGLRGAVQSSSTLQPEGQIVQYAYPYQQWELVDFLIKIQKEILTITDCGAGGLSSAVGEMSYEAGGAVVMLDRVPLRTPLAPHEIWCSESQERIVFCTHQFAKVKEVAQQMGVLCEEIGYFTGDGKIQLLYYDECITEIDLDLLFEKAPKPHLEAVRPKIPLQVAMPHRKPLPPNALAVLMELLQKRKNERLEELITHWDGEVLGRCKERNVSGNSFMVKEVEMNLSVGISGLWGLIDGARAGLKAFDEAYRNAIVQGLDPNRLVALDNFSWVNVYPGENNPRAKERLGLLSDTCLTLKECIQRYQVPFVSGKDSMMNEGAIPTLVVTMVGPKKAQRRQVAAKDFAYLLPPIHPNCNYSELSNLYEGLEEHTPGEESFNWDKIMRGHQLAASLSTLALVDVGRGGYLTTLIRFLLQQNLGLIIGPEVLESHSPFAEGFAGYILFSPTPLNAPEIVLLGEVTGLPEVYAFNSVIRKEDVL